jgi:hypothetical protein
MQENFQTWNPIYEPAPLVWEVRLFLIYLFLACGLLLVMCVELLWKFRRISQAIQAGADAKIGEVQRHCSRKVVNLKRMAVFTLVLSGLILLDGGARLFFAASNEKTTPHEAYFRPAGGILFIFMLGVLVCAAFYIAYRLLDRVLSKRARQIVEG